MASKASDQLKAELQADGENDTTWGQKLNVAVERLEQAITGETDIALSSSDYTLDDTQYSKGSGTTAEAHRFKLNCTGTLTSNVNVIVPAREKFYLVNNDTSGAYTVTVKTSGGSGIAVTQGEKAFLWCDATNVVKILATDDALNNVVEDTTPQLGGDLDLNGNVITGLEIGVDVQAYDADTLKADTGDTLSAGFDVSSPAAATKTTGTYTPVPTSETNMVPVINGGAHTLAPPSTNCTMILQYTNNSSAGAITTSGFTVVDGDTISTTDGDDFFFYITVIGSFSHLHVKALQ